MGQQQFDIGSPSGRCAVTGREFQEGEEFYTVLFEDGESFRRTDFSLEGWNGPPDGSFCHFKTRVPVKEKKRQLLVNAEVLTHFFERLADETEAVRIQFRFVLALILMRKRILRYESSATADGSEVWTMTLMVNRSTHRVVNPRLTDEQIEGVSRQLSAILHSDMGEWAQPPDEQDQPEPDDNSQDQPREECEAPTDSSSST
jgi:hypothetical protein